MGNFLLKFRLYGTSTLVLENMHTHKKMDIILPIFDQISDHEINMKYTAIEQILLHTPPLLFIQSLPLSLSYLAELYLLFLLYGSVTDIGSTFGRHLLLLAKTHREREREIWSRLFWDLDRGALYLLYWGCKGV